MYKFKEVRCLDTEKPFFEKGKVYYISSMSPDLGDGYHVYVNARHSGWICNIDTETAARFFGI